MGQIGCPETSVATVRNIQKERISQMEIYLT
jgi:hypothetical protein